MKRYLVCKVTKNEATNEYVPAIDKHTPFYAAWYFKNNQYAVCLATAANFVAIAADPDIVLLPDLTFDTTLSALSTVQRNALKNALEARGLLTTVDGQLVVSTSRPWGQALNLIVRQIEPAFYCLAYDIGNVES